MSHSQTFIKAPDMVAIPILGEIALIFVTSLFSYPHGGKKRKIIEIASIKSSSRLMLHMHMKTAAC
jgi:hypothetical protein